MLSQQRVTPWRATSQSRKHADQRSIPVTQHCNTAQKTSWNFKALHNLPKLLCNCHLGFMFKHSQACIWGPSAPPPPLVAWSTCPSSVCSTGRDAISASAAASHTNAGSAPGTAAVSAEASGVDPRNSCTSCTSCGAARGYSWTSTAPSCAHLMLTQSEVGLLKSEVESNNKRTKTSVFYTMHGDVLPQRR